MLSSLRDLPGKFSTMHQLLNTSFLNKLYKILLMAQPYELIFVTIDDAQVKIEPSKNRTKSS